MDIILKSEVQEIRWSDEHWQIQGSYKYYEISSYYIIVDLIKYHQSKMYDDKASISSKKKVCKNVNK